MHAVVVNNDVPLTLQLSSMHLYLPNKHQVKMHYNLT